MSDAAVSLPPDMLAPTSSLQKDAAEAVKETKAAAKQRDAAGAELDKAYTAQEGEVKKQRGDIKEFATEHPFPHPDLKPWTEKPPENDPMKSFGSWASAFGILAGAITRTGLASSLNAGASAMNAIRKNDMEAYHEAKEVWKDNTEMAIQNAEWETKGYQAAFDLMEKDHAAGMSLYQVIAAKAQNNFALAAAKQNDTSKMWEIHKGLADFAAQGPERMLRMQELGQKVEDLQARAKLYKQWQDQNPTATPEVQAQKRTEIMNPQYTINQARTIAENTNSNGMSRDPVAIKYWAKRVRAGEPMPALGYGKDAALFRREVAVQAARDADETGGSAELDIAKKAMLKAESESLKKQIASQHAINQFEKTAEKNLDIAVSLVDKVDSTGIPVAERWIRNGRRALAGDPDVTNFDFQMGVLTPEIAKIITNPNLSGILSDSARQEAGALLDKSITADQLKNLVPLIKGDFTRRKDAIQEEIDATTDTITQLGAMTSESLKKGDGGAAHPPVPAGVPETAQWSASTRTFWWQDGNEWKSKEAK